MCGMAGVVGHWHIFRFSSAFRRLEAVVLMRGPPIHQPELVRQGARGRP